MTQLQENFWQDIFKIVQLKKNADPSKSYTAKLWHDPAFNAQKVGEEAVEVVVAALAQEKQDVIYETCDLIYHLTVLLEKNNITLQDLRQELSRRNHEILDKDVKS